MRGLRNSIRHLKEADAKVLNVALDERLTNREKLLRLQSVKISTAGKGYLRVLYDLRLTDAERMLPEVAGVLAEHYLQDGEFAKVQAILLPVCKTSSDPRLMYWLAWCRGPLENSTPLLTP